MLGATRAKSPKSSEAMTGGAAPRPLCFMFIRVMIHNARIDKLTSTSGRAGEEAGACSGFGLESREARVDAK
jgi:hypothetical protein